MKSENLSQEKPSFTIKEKIKLIKYLRLKPEERFILEMIDGIEIHEQQTYQHFIFWKKDNIVLFEQDFENGYLRVNNNKIWSIFKHKYGYTYDETQSFIKKIIDKDTKLNGSSYQLVNHCRTETYDSPECKGLIPDRFDVISNPT